MFPQPGVMVVTTGQGSEITFGLDNLDQQLQRWRQIYDWACGSRNPSPSADLAVANNVPVRWMMASAAPVADAQGGQTQPVIRRRHV